MREGPNLQSSHLVARPTNGSCLESTSLELKTGEGEEDDGVELPLPAPSQAPIVVLEIDQKTPDKHVCRDRRLIRLTGAHPFNAEAPLSALVAEGFLTSPELFFVRNHGPVPEVRDEEIPDWEFTVSG